jgi:hypothetical protein
MEVISISKATIPCNLSPLFFEDKSVTLIGFSEFFCICQPILSDSITASPSMILIFRKHERPNSSMLVHFRGHTKRRKCNCVALKMVKTVSSSLNTVGFLWQCVLVNVCFPSLVASSSRGI